MRMQLSMTDIMDEPKIVKGIVATMTHEHLVMDMQCVKRVFQAAFTPGTQTLLA
jgi:hypothetical protein